MSSKLKALRSLFATISISAVALMLFANVASAKVLTCPVDFQSWKVHNSFAAGYQGLCSYYSRLSDEGKVSFKEAGNFNNSGVLSELPLSVWDAVFESQDWNNGYSSFIVR